MVTPESSRLGGGGGVCFAAGCFGEGCLAGFGFFAGAAARALALSTRGSSAGAASYGFGALRFRPPTTSGTLHGPWWSRLSVQPYRPHVKGGGVVSSFPDDAAPEPAASAAAGCVAACVSPATSGICAKISSSVGNSSVDGCSSPRGTSAL
jgi:hypothetical protein